MWRLTLLITTIKQAVWALGNIAGDSAKCRDLVLSLGVLEPLINIIQTSQNVTMLRNATWTMSNLCRGKPIPDFNQVCYFFGEKANVWRKMPQIL